MEKENDFQKALEEFLELRKKVEKLHSDMEKSKEVESLLKDASYAREVLKCKGSVSMTLMAKELGMSSALVLQQELEALGIIFKTRDDEWALTSRYSTYGLTKNRTLNFRGRVRRYFVWTETGRRWLHSLKGRGVLNSAPMPIGKKKEKEYKLVEVEKIGRCGDISLRIKDEVGCLLSLTRDYSRAKDLGEQRLLANDIMSISRTLIGSILSLQQICVDRLK